MSAVKEVPTNIYAYFRNVKEVYENKKEELTDKARTLRKELDDLYRTIAIDFYKNKKEYPIDLSIYSEYNVKQYINGEFLRVAKGVLMNREGNYELNGRRFEIYRLAKLQKDIYDADREISLCDKILNLKRNEYVKLIKTFYTKVQEKMIIDGCGYVFEGRLGWICINRVKNSKNGSKIDYMATKKRRAQLIAEGKRIYNKEEADWCEANGIKYEAEDVRVFQTDKEFIYEVPLLSCRVKHGDSYVFQTADYRGNSVRGKSNDDILKESNGDKYEICKYDIDIRTKLNICLKADSLLYTKFIRNENQTTYTNWKASR